ncbi:hypothetical protein HO173_001107 [Letharia columbiana]|uniref:Xylulose kinase n=1 Tax=Letharia columbiana TaxID=112416 RepID=A0A8H6G4J3_9LECA|nr:uncharacterized protein HO173_001107 [Letharia columbiana]KAF6240439.1 hypothetical protein HO173_001107 [Letharia columbiana]
MIDESPLYLGFDLSTQQLKGIAITSDLKVAYEAVFDFDADATGFGIKNGVLTNEAEDEVYAPVTMWLQAIDAVLQRLQDKGIDFGRVRGISGAGQQHGSVYWSEDGEHALQNLHEGKSLEAQLHHAFSYPYSPNWQDSSTQKQCDSFDRHLGDEVQLALHTGSKAHHRFTGPQILRFRSKHPDAYSKTSRISLVSSFLASVFVGKIAPIDIADVCGMNLFDIKAGSYNQKLMALAAGPSDLESKLGHVPEDGGGSFGEVQKYFVRRYGFNPSCTIAPFTGDNPSTILALPLRPLDAIVSLGTSTTFLMSTPHYKPDPAVHFMNHPTTSGLYMFMLCYKNGGLAREQIRDALPPTPPGISDRWSLFNYHATHTRPLGASIESSPAKIALYFPRPEIVPNVQAGIYRFTYTGQQPTVSSPSAWKLPEDDCRAILESQLLSLRLRSRGIVAPPSPNPQNVPAQPRRVYLVGGGSRNTAIAKLAGEILGGVEGVYRLDVGGNACALGSAYKAVWAVERKPGETFEDLIGSRWREDEFVEKIADGYQEEIYRMYEKGVDGLEAVEKSVLEEQARDVGKASTTGAGQV